jgi:hypothetical protein
LHSFGNLKFFQKGKLFLVFPAIPMKNVEKFGDQEGHKFEY